MNWKKEKKEKRQIELMLVSVHVIWLRLILPRESGNDICCRFEFNWLENLHIFILIYKLSARKLYLCLSLFVGNYIYTSDSGLNSLECHSMRLEMGGVCGLLVVLPLHAHYESSYTVTMIAVNAFKWFQMQSVACHKHLPTGRPEAINKLKI